MARHMIDTATLQSFIACVTQSLDIAIQGYSEALAEEDTAWNLWALGAAIHSYSAAAIRKTRFGFNGYRDAACFSKYTLHQSRSSADKHIGVVESRQMRDAPTKHKVSADHIKVCTQSHKSLLRDKCRSKIQCNLEPGH